MSLIEEALKRAKRDAAATDPKLRPRVEVPALVPDRAVSSGKLAAKLVSRPVIEIEKHRLRDAGLAPATSAERRLTAEYRAIKRALLGVMARRTASGAERGNSVMIASAVPGEGKTFTSLNLAMSLAAERDWIIVLVDADGAKQHLSSVFGLRDERGLLDVLADPRSSLSDAMFRTSLPNLNIVPAGRASDSATELIASSRMTQIVSEFLRDEPRAIVLFDSSPLLLTTESRALADSVGQVLLVVRADVTPRASVQEALAALGEGHHVSLILNECQGTAIQEGYYPTEGEARPTTIDS
jgi:protein-tyrosine kinase